MKTLHLIFPTLFVAILITGCRTNAPTKDEKTVFREPFTLKLPVDKEHYYEQRFAKVPYVFDGHVYLFKDDEFGLVLDVRGNSIRNVLYERDLKKADVTLKFT